MPRFGSVTLFMMAAAGSLASASNFTWLGTDGLWTEHLKWFGPAGLFPNSVLDQATVNGSDAEITLNTNITLGGLTIANGAQVFSSQHSIFVAGDVNISGPTSSLSLTESPALRDMDCDTMVVSGGFYSMYAGVAEFDESLRIEQDGVVAGVGTIEMNSTTGDFVVDDSTVWATVNGFQDNALRIRRTASSTSRLDCTDPDSVLLVWSGVSMDVQIPFRGTVGGMIRVTGDGVFRSDHPVVGSGGSRVQLAGGLLLSETSTFEAPVVDLAGSLEVGGRSVIDAPLIALRGTALLAPDASLRLHSAGVNLDSLIVQGDGGSGGEIRFGQGVQTTINVMGGATSIATGVGGVFDLDGRGDQIVNIASGSSLAIATEQIDLGADDFAGTLNNAGVLNISSFGAPGSDEWSVSGLIDLDQGQIQGRRLINRGQITGRGTLTAPVVNAGQITAENGALFFSSLVLDAGETNAPIVRAQDGEIALTAPASDIIQDFAGAMFVGNGSGVRESFEMNSPLRIRVAHGRAGSLELNDGLVRARRLFLQSNFVSNGLSELRSSGSLDLIEFSSGSSSTINGVLELSGQVRFYEGTYAGDGLLRAPGVDDVVRLFPPTDLNTVSLEAAGSVEVNNGSAGQVGMNALTLLPSATLHIDLGDDGFGNSHDHVVVAGQATLGGQLKIGASIGATLPFGQTFTVLTAGEVIGDFDSVDDSQLGPAYRTFVTVHPDRVEIYVGCFADLQPNGAVDFFDIAEFLNLYNAMDPLADVNEDGLFNFFDIAVFIGLFNNGC